MSEELKPCPFCGGKPRVALGEHDFDGAEVICQSCAGSSGHFSDDKEADQASRHWNTRADNATIAELRAEVERWKAAYEEASDNHSLAYQEANRLSDELDALRDKNENLQARLKVYGWDEALRRHEAVARVARVPGTEWKSLDFFTELQEIPTGTRLYTAPIAKEQGEWIACAERLPEYGVKVLVVCQYGLLYWREREKFQLPESSVPTYWRYLQLPAAPSRQGEEGESV
jgi:Lar family restriction alleviation protein